MTNLNPIPRSPLRNKKKPVANSVLHPNKQRLTDAQKAQVRNDIWLRSEGQCENSLLGERCSNHIYWHTMHLHHIRHRSLGGKWNRENLLATCIFCHREHHDGKRKIAPYFELERTA